MGVNKGGENITVSGHSLFLEWQPLFNLLTRLRWHRSARSSMWVGPSTQPGHGTNDAAWLLGLIVWPLSLCASQNRSQWLGVGFTTCPSHQQSSSCAAAEAL